MGPPSPDEESDIEDEEEHEDEEEDHKNLGHELSSTLLSALKCLWTTGLTLKRMGIKLRQQFSGCCWTLL